MQSENKYIYFLHAIPVCCASKGTLSILGSFLSSLVVIILSVYLVYNSRQRKEVEKGACFNIRESKPEIDTGSLHVRLCEALLLSYFLFDVSLFLLNFPQDTEYY